MKGSEVGIASMVAAFVLAVGTAYQWIQRVDAVHHSEGEGALARGAFGFARGLVPRAAEGGEPYVEPVIRSWTWWQSGGIEFGLGQHIDGLAVMLLLLVTFISTLVQIFSLEYVRGDRRYTHFFASITLFTAGMLTMVLAENMVQLILGWEIMGLCSFMLIGHWWEEQANSRAALKAFFTVRVGDMGLLVGIAHPLRRLRHVQHPGSTSRIAHGSGARARPCSCGRRSHCSSPASARAASSRCTPGCPTPWPAPRRSVRCCTPSTMVVAGVFLVARLYPVFYNGFDIAQDGNSVNLIAVIGGITILIAAGLAFVQNDIKKVLAYSTVSQLGYMMMGLGVGAWTPAVFHIFTHAFFKCCLFLCAGSVSHTGEPPQLRHEEGHGRSAQEDADHLRERGSCRRSPCAACRSSAASSRRTRSSTTPTHNDYTVFFIIGLIGAFMTTAYMTRATYLTFFGTPRGAAAGEHHDDEAHAEEHELGLATVGHGDAADHTAHHEHEAHAVHDAHGHDAHDAHGHDDHAAHGKPAFGIAGESPILLVFPLIILGFLAVVERLPQRSAVPHREVPRVGRSRGRASVAPAIESRRRSAGPRRCRRSCWSHSASSSACCCARRCSARPTRR